MIVEIPLQAEVQCSVERIFEVIADLNGQDRWLDRSTVFRGTVDVSDNPVRLGSTYREPSPQGVRHGEVTEFEPPVRITFHHPLNVRPFGRIDFVQRYTLERSAIRPWCGACQSSAFPHTSGRQLASSSARPLGKADEL